MSDIVYTPVYSGGWLNRPSRATPANAAALTHIEAGITAATNQANAALTAAGTGGSGGGGVAVSEGGTWTTGTVYAAGKIVTQAGKRYECLTGHTAGTFATDLAAGGWLLLGVDPASAVTLPAHAAGWLHDDGTGVLAWSTPAPGDTGAVAKAGDTMTGPLSLSGAPTASLHAATKGYVDSLAGGSLTLPQGFRVMQPATVTSGAVYPIGGISSGATTNVGGDTIALLVPFMLDVPGTFYLGCSLTGAASAGGVLRFAIYTDNGLAPNAVTDLGTVAATTTDATNGLGHYSSGSVALNSQQRYWAAVGSQGAATTQPVFRAVSPPNWALPVLAGSTGFSYRMTVGASAPFAPTPTMQSTQPAAPLFLLKAA